MLVRRDACSQSLMNSLTFFTVSGVSSVQRMFCLIVVFSLLLVLTGPARAVVVQGLYSQTVPVTDKGAQDQNDAMGRALADVLVKVSGRENVLSNPVIRKALSKPENYVQKYGFQGDARNPGRQQYFQADFNEQAINNLLRSAGLAIWGANRSPTIVWLALDNGGRRSIVSASGNLAMAFAAGFQHRGLPVLFPLMDVDDSNAISAVDIWGGFNDKVRRASRRYGTESVLTGRLTQKGGIYSGRLSLLFRGSVAKSAAVDGLDAAGVAQLATSLTGSALSGHYAIDASQNAGNTVLVVENVASLEAYAALNSYLEQIMAIRDVSVRKVDGATIELVLAFDGSQNQLVEALAQGRTLVPVTELTPSTIEPAPMLYRWVSRR